MTLLNVRSHKESNSRTESRKDGGAAEGERGSSCLMGTDSIWDDGKVPAMDSGAGCPPV